MCIEEYCMLYVIWGAGKTGRSGCKMLGFDVMTPV